MQLRLSRRADYAVRAVLALAEADRQLTTAELARRMEMPPGFLPQIMPALVRGGILRRRLGRHGGYVLARAASAISLLDIIEAADGRRPARSCVLRGGACRGDQPCAVHPAIAAAEDAQRAALAAADCSALLAGRAALPGRSSGEDGLSRCTQSRRTGWEGMPIVSAARSMSGGCYASGSC